MSRQRKAALSAGFTYMKFALAMLPGVILIPLILNRVGARNYGLWLATGELIAYMALFDIGVFSVLPWMVAEADGKSDRLAIRRILSNGLVVGLLVGTLYFSLLSALWLLIPGAFHLTVQDRQVLNGPFWLLITATALAYPIRVFAPILAGLQDVLFNGILSLVTYAAGAALTILLLLSGAGLYALAASGATVPLLVAITSAVRVRVIAPDLLRDFEAPSWLQIRVLFKEGFGGWLGNWGFQLMAASNGLIMTVFGHPEWVPTYVLTYKLAQILTQLSWVLPDSGLIGLAQLAGEGKPERVRKIALAILRLSLFLSSAAAFIILILNPSFVRFWVGSRIFGGFQLNALFACFLIISSLDHSLLCMSATLGRRMRVGIAAVLNGIVYVATGFMLVRILGLIGLALGSILSTLLTTSPLGLTAFQKATGLKSAHVLRDLLGLTAYRALPMLVVAFYVGQRLAEVVFWKSALLALPLGLLHLWWMRPLFKDFPFPAKLTERLAALRVFRPSITPATVEQS